MRQRGLFALLAAGAFTAALAGCSRNKAEVAEPGPDPDPQTDPPAGKRAACDQEIAVECPDGMEDGCGRQAGDGSPLTAYHVCVPAEEQAAQPCEQEIARECGEGLVDACLVDPPAASSHICVQATAGAEPSDPAEPSEPSEPAEPAEPTEPSEG